MALLDRNLRRDLENAVKKARCVAEAGARDAINQLAVGHHEPWPMLSPEQRKLRNRLRAHGRQLGDKLDERKGTQTIERLTGECAYEHWHRLLFARFLAENDLLVEPESGMALSLDECRELAREQGKDWLVLASDFAQRMLPQIFRAGDPVLEVALPPEKRQELEAILEQQPRDVFIADDSLGWVYQYWQTEQKDAVNASGNKIGADELSPATQIFTEDYMVLFLLHNTIGAWWAARRRASGQLLDLPGYALTYLRTDGDGAPIAGSFSGWASSAKALRMLDPSMGSGHFLAFALPLLVAIRRVEEGLTVEAAVDAVLRDNIFGLEVDPRCTQIAAFNLAMSAWRLGGRRELPELNLACSGLGINAKKSAWVELAGDDGPSRQAMEELYVLFEQAPLLGSLIDPTRVGGTLLSASFERVLPHFEQAIAAERDDSTTELAVAARGVAKAARILGERFTLVITNVPYLGRGKQCDALKDFCETHHADAKADLATCFVQRCLRWCVDGGSTALVTPQNWLFLSAYRRLREQLLREEQWDLAVKLGPAAFQDMNFWAATTALVTLTRGRAAEGHSLSGLDVSGPRETALKAAELQSNQVWVLGQRDQLKNPDARISFREGDDEVLLARYATGYQGVATADYSRFGRCFWEVAENGERWSFQQSTVENTTAYGGREHIVLWEQGRGALAASEQARVQGLEALGRRGVVVSQMNQLPVTLFTGELFDNNCSAVVVKDDADLLPVWAFCSSDDYRRLIREIDQQVKVTNATLVKVAFDIEQWRDVAAERFPNGVPRVAVSDPTQWLFDGRPRGSDHPLHVAVARLLGYKWPRQLGVRFDATDPYVDDGLDVHVDDDGIVCLPSIRGEAAAADRIQAFLASALAPEWSAAVLTQLLQVEGAQGSLDDWLRNSFFESHCEIFHQRPFVWQVWDGLRDGFSALVSYHRLAAPNGEGKRTLEKLIYTYLGDWLDRQRADQKAGVEGADGRVAAAEHLKRELEKILEGEPPYDIFVRWKPLEDQPVGWSPDIDDGVRVNIRPFMVARPLNARGKNASILRVTPRIHWRKDKGKEASRSKSEFPWFWGWDESAQDIAGGKEFDGNRWNDLHYSPAAKLAARERAKAKGGKS
ncbi:SAM-dependent methyltransferase [Corallococcus sp. AB018]|uniref:Eco57I restriction-modification methylase domain-containing protein n=1 Tax=Corallococcus sp. AB018 TaxID=2316715 RepID=UPI000F869ACE|nr:N-6 DNA methylase [Corallococcus sp. AB018]RUO91233.1 SAM-dependent methyltransferase [Corallococcus sp. AB018]